MLLRRLLIAVLLWICSTAHADVQIDWVVVGNPGNPPDERSGYGQVDTTFRMGQFEVTNAQYTDFLNAVDPLGSDKYDLYANGMNFNPIGGIVFDPQRPDGDKFFVKPGRENNPVCYTNFYDALRFVNWLHNGQGSGGTEDGAYTLLGDRPIPTNANLITRNPEARYFIPNENEWYKAAFHKNDGVTGNYWYYTTASDEIPYSDQPPGSDAPTAANTANFFRDDELDNGFNDGYGLTGESDFSYALNYLTDVGAYTEASGPYGTFDMGGNVYEWTEDFRTAELRGIRGGSFNSHANYLSIAYPLKDRPPFLAGDLMGFRIAGRYESMSLPGDFDGSGELDVADIDALAVAMREGSEMSFDLDNNGRVDTGDHRYWVKSLRQTWFGDADLDGEFRSSDLVQVLAAGEYEDDQPLNSSWGTGDWDGDGDFTSQDLIRAMTDGGYELPSPATALTVPEPAPMTLIVFAATGCLAAFSRR